MPAFLYEFEWDPVKAAANVAKHGLDFERASTVFLDPLAVTIPDEEHSKSEVRWIYAGKGYRRAVCALSSHFRGVERPAGRRVRLISARKPTRAEIRGYEEQTSNLNMISVSANERAAPKGVPPGEMGTRF